MTSIIIKYFSENSFNCTITLNGIHRFNDDKVYSNLLKRLCENELTQRNIDLLENRVIGQNGLTLPNIIPGDTCYACQTNSKRNSITASIFNQHVQVTHPDAQSNTLPPDHTIIIEADIQSTNGFTNGKNMQSLQRRIIELGDDNVRYGTKLIDPCLCCYTGGFFMCNSNEKFNENDTRNETQFNIV